MAGHRASQPNESIYRAILIVLVVSLLAGVAIALVGEFRLHSAPVSRAGAWLAIVSGAIYLFYRWLGRREARRRAVAREPGDDPQDSSRTGQ